jgi:hypothetical protein
VPRKPTAGRVDRADWPQTPARPATHRWPSYAVAAERFPTASRAVLREAGWCRNVAVPEIYDG